MTEPARARATYEDVLAAPPEQVAEVVSGELHLSPRPAFGHARASTGLTGQLDGPFYLGRGGPGGWIILAEPELHLGGEPAIVVPDLAGWRRETMPELPEVAFTTIVPDWACEVLSPSTRRFDRGEKVPLYAREGVGHLWLIEPTDQLVEVLRLEGGRYTIVATVAGEVPARLEPFDAIEIDLAALWMR
jgi:Uma2 family endonuclease